MFIKIDGLTENKFYNDSNKGLFFKRPPFVGLNLWIFLETWIANIVYDYLTNHQKRYIIVDLD